MALTSLLATEGIKLERLEKILCEAAGVPISLENTRIQVRKAVRQFAEARNAELIAEKEPPVEF